MLPASVKLVLFDMTGTTVDDRLAGASFVITAFVDAFAEHGIVIAPAEVGPHRGKQKRRAIREILGTRSSCGETGVESLTAKIYEVFLGRLREQIPHLQEIEGTTELFVFLKKRGLKVGVGSGFPPEIVEMIVSHLGWKEANLIDYVQSSEFFGVSRPDPAMIKDMMAYFAVDNPREVVKVGDTRVDILEGKNAGVWTVGVLTGSQSKSELQAVEPDFLLGSIRELRTLFPKSGEYK